MPGLRRLRDVASKISGVLADPRPQGDETSATAGAPAGEQEDGSGVPQVEDGASASSGDSPEVDVVAPEEAPSQARSTDVEATAEDARAGAPASADAPASGASGASGASEPTGDGSGAAVRDEVQPPSTPVRVPLPVVVADEPDAACAAAVDLARAAAVEVGGAAVGEHLGAGSEPAVEGDHLVTHSFAAELTGYRGWRWAVTVARAEGSDVVTVDEVVLLPGEGALLAPAWLPWADRVQPDDLGPGDLLPPPPDDPRVVPSYEQADAPELPFDLHRDLGLGRARVLSREGRVDAAERWYDGPGGPDTPLAKQAPGRCATCAFFVPLAGALGRGFGACANGMAPDDGRVVALRHGCGAHSETVTTSPHANTTSLAVEHEELELVDVAALPEQR